jgi:hypothetical protein
MLYSDSRLSEDKGRRIHAMSWDKDRNVFGTAFHRRFTYPRHVEDPECHANPR